MQFALLDCRLMTVFRCFSGHRRRLMALLLLFASGMFAAEARAADAIAMSVDASRDVIYCDAKLNHGLDRIAHALSEGTSITFDWEIEVAAARSYWFDKHIASVHIAYRVVPDLLSRSWQLIDLGSGITRRVFTLEQAVQFLVQLERFPVLDRSLLNHEETYRMNITLMQQVGEMEAGWWATLWGSGEISSMQEFSLP